MSQAGPLYHFDQPVGNFRIIMASALFAQLHGLVTPVTGAQTADQYGRQTKFPEPSLQFMHRRLPWPVACLSS